MVYTGTENLMNRRIIPGIFGRESNEDGGHLFMSLYTGKVIHSNDWVELLIYDEVVTRIEELAKIEKQPTFDQYPMFETIISVEGQHQQETRLQHNIIGESKS